MKNRVLWVCFLLMFLYTDKRYDLDDHYVMPYNKGATVDEIYRG
jgi:hypothetical protein